MSLMRMLKAQSGINIDPATVDYLKKMQGQTGPTAPQVPGATPPIVPEADQAIPEVPGMPKAPGMLSVAGDALSTIGQSSGEFTQDATGVTQVSDSGDITKGAIGKGIKAGMATGNPLVGVGLAGLAYVAGKVQQGSERRRALREEDQNASDFQRAQQASSVYSDPNSVYYSAKDGAPVKSIYHMMSGGKKC